MPSPINLPIAHAAQAYWCASKQGLEGAHDWLTAKVSTESLLMIHRARVSDRLTAAAMDSLCLIARRRGERRGTAV